MMDTHFNNLCGYQYDKTSVLYVGFGVRRMCYVCNRNVPHVYNYKINDILYNLCELCNTVYTYNTAHLKYGILCSSDVDQLEIIKKTHEHFIRFKRIPNIVDIDENAKLINAPTPDIIIAMSKGNCEQKNKFDNIKLYFTDKIKLTSLAQTTKFGQTIPNVRRYRDYGFFLENNLEKVCLTKEQCDVIKLFALLD